MHSTHTGILCVRLKCRGNTVQFKKRNRRTDKKEDKTTQKLLKLKNYVVYKALIGYNRQPHASSLLLFMCEKILKIAALM